MIILKDLFATKSLKTALNILLYNDLRHLFRFSHQIKIMANYIMDIRFIKEEQIMSNASWKKTELDTLRLNLNLRLKHLAKLFPQYNLTQVRTRAYRMRKQLRVNGANV